MAEKQATMAGEVPKNKDDRMDIDPPIGRKPKEGKPIKVYPFAVDHLCEENARYWFYEMETQLGGQYAWEAIELYEEYGPVKFKRMLADHEWERVNRKANLIIQKGLSPTTILEIKDMNLAGDRWTYLREKFLTPNNAMKAMKLMQMANWTWDRSTKASKAWTELKQLGMEFIEMNGSETIRIMDILLIWYLRGLGNDFRQTRDTLMSTEDVLEEKVVINRVRGVEQMYGQGENASRASQQDRPRGPKCYSCQGYGHKAAKCPNQQREDDSENRSSSTSKRDSQGGRGRGRGSGRGSSRQNHGGRTAEEQNVAQSSDEERGNRIVEEYDYKVDSEIDSEKAGFIQEEAHRSSSHRGWVFDSSTTSMSTGDRSIFKYMDPCVGTLKIASRT